MSPLVTRLRFALLTALILSVLPVLAGPTPARPDLLTAEVRGSKARVQVPLGVVQVVLEQRQGMGWKPVAARHLAPDAAAAARDLSFALPKGLTATGIRILGYRTAKFPARTAKATRSFKRSGQVLSPELVYSMAGTAVADGAGQGAGERGAAVESDIWKIAGDQLFFFNQYRGLQVFDMKNPAAPLRTGTLRLAASGEQFYALDARGEHLALLGRSNSADRPGAATLFVLAVSNGVPDLEAEVPLDGTVSDSRLSGDKLYVMSTDYKQIDGVWGAETQIQTIDLADPLHPAIRSTLRLTGNATAMQAAGDYLLVATTSSDWWNWNVSSRLHLTDIAAADGSPFLRKGFDLKGQVQDKFKLGIVNGAVVSTSLYWNHWSQETWVETFPVVGAATAALAQLELTAARGEQLHATRYDGNRLYVVTFRNTDPLFVVDLADPAAPSLSGILEIPGWSTYIEPLGDRLLAVGVEAGRVTVSLFDVADAAAPALLSRIPLGAEGTWNWSEANYDEKAVEYFPESGIVLVPFQNYTSDGHVKAIQAIAVGTDTVAADALIPHDFDPGRGGVMGDYFVSVSGQELLVLDRTKNTTGEPDVQMSLARTTDRVIPLGDYLVQIEDGGNWYGGPYLRIAQGGWNTPKSMVRITMAADPDDLVQEIELGAGRIVGSTTRDNRLYLAQWVSADGDDPARLVTWIFDLSAPPALPVVTTLEHRLKDVSEWSLNLAAGQLLWVNNNNLVWHAPAQSSWGYWWGGPIAYAVDAPVVADLAVSSVTTRAVLPPVMSDAAAITLVGVVCPIRNVDGTLTAGTPLQIQSTGSLRGAGQALVRGGFLFFSFDTATQDAHKAYPTVDGSYRWMPPSETRRSWLQVVDLRPASPVVRDPVFIPGELLSVDQVDAQGAVLVTNKERWIASRSRNNRTLNALAYDGAAASLLDTLDTTSPYGSASASDGTRIFLANASPTPASWQLATTQLLDACWKRANGSWRPRPACIPSGAMCSPPTPAPSIWPR